jgi:hypothetical protein
MGETMKNKILLAAALFLILGVTGAAQETGESQLQLRDIFSNENTRLNAVYAVDQQDNFYGILFGEDQANFFGTVDSFEALQGENIEVCQHYLTRRGGFLGGMNPFSDESTESTLNCVPLQEDMESGQVPIQPQQNQTENRSAN